MSFIDATGLTQAVAEIKAYCVQTFAALVHSHSNATPSTSGTGGTAGFMSATDKEKLDGVATGANAYVLPAATTSTLGGVKPDGTTVTVDNDGTIHSAGGTGAVSGVKGDAESTYRTGNVNLTYSNLGTNSVGTGGTGQTSSTAVRTRFGSIPLATSSTSASTAAKVATLTNFELFEGARVLVKFTNANTKKAALTLNVNSTTGKTIYAGGASTSASNNISWTAGAICEFIYDGSYWHYLGNNIDGYEDYAAGQAVADLATYTGANGTSYAAYGTIQHQVDTLRDSVDHIFIAANASDAITDLNTFYGGIGSFDANATGSPNFSGFVLAFSSGSWTGQIALSIEDGSLKSRRLRWNSWTSWV